MVQTQTKEEKDQKPPENAGEETVLIEDSEDESTHEVQLLTEEELKEAGVHKDEIEMIKKRGLVLDPKDKKKENEEDEKGKSKENNDANEVKDDTKKEEAAEEKENKDEKDKEKKPKDYFKDRTPEEEIEFVRGLTFKEAGIYKDLKKVRKRAQQAEDERNYYKLKLQELEKENQNPKNKVVNDDESKDIYLNKEEETGEQKAKYLTEKDIEERERKREEERRVEEEEKMKFNQAMLDLEKEMSEQDPAHAVKMALADDLMRQENEMGSNFYASQLYNASQKYYFENKGNPIEVAYKIATFHPDYHKKLEELKLKNSGGNPDEENNETTSKIHKMIDNKGKRNSSESVGASKGRRYTVDNIKLEDVPKINLDTWRKLPPEKKRELLGG